MPAEAGKAGKVTIVGVDDGAVLDGGCGDGCICHRAALDVQSQIPQQLPVSRSRIEDAHVGLSQPAIYDRESLSDFKAGCSEGAIRDYAQEAVHA